MPDMCPECEAFLRYFQYPHEEICPRCHPEAVAKRVKEDQEMAYREFAKCMAGLVSVCSVSIVGGEVE